MGIFKFISARKRVSGVYGNRKGEFGEILRERRRSANEERFGSVVVTAQRTDDIKGVFYSSEKRAPDTVESLLLEASADSTTVALLHPYSTVFGHSSE